jgi:hypothetical protein
LREKIIRLISMNEIRINEHERSHLISDPKKGFNERIEYEH